MVPEALFALAVQAQTDDDAIPVLGDFIIEAGWDHPWVLPLCVGTPLDTEEPDSARSYEGAARWRKQRLDSIDFANQKAFWYAGKSAAWARAVLASMMFGSWPAATTTTPGYIHDDRTRSPWPLIREQHLARSRDERRENSRRRKERTAAYESRKLAALAQRVHGE